MRMSDLPPILTVKQSDNIKITELPDGSAIVEDEDGITVYSAEEFAELQRRDTATAEPKIRAMKGGTNPMNKREHLVRAILKTEEAIANLRIAKQELLYARSDQHVRLALALAEIEEIYEILTDPVCTPEIAKEATT